jgi:hypothetical protein
VSTNLTNGYANGVWKKAGKTLVSSVTSVLIVNFTDPKGVIFDWPWIKHVIIAIVILTIVNEARYWKNWADNGTQSA